MLCDWLVIHQVLPVNPTAAGPEARGDQRGDAGADAGRDAVATRWDRPGVAGRSSWPGVDRSGRLSGRSLTRRVVLAMIKRRAAAAGLPTSTCCHTFRATGITALEHAQQIAGHASPRTTKLYDRTADTVTLDEIERIVI